MCFKRARRAFKKKTKIESVVCVGLFFLKPSPSFFLRGCATLAYFTLRGSDCQSWLDVPNKPFTFENYATIFMLHDLQAMNLIITKKK